MYVDKVIYNRDQLTQYFAHLEITFFLKWVDTEERISWCCLADDKPICYIWFQLKSITWTCPPHCRIYYRNVQKSRSSDFRKQNTSLTWSKKTFKFTDGREHIYVHDNTAPSSKALILVTVRQAHSHWQVVQHGMTSSVKEAIIFNL